MEARKIFGPKGRKLEDARENAEWFFPLFVLH
jgi:hypothetical protein